LKILATELSTINWNTISILAGSRPELAIKRGATLSKHLPFIIGAKLIPSVGRQKLTSTMKGRRLVGVFPLASTRSPAQLGMIT